MLSFGENTTVLGKNRMILPGNSPTISNNAGIFTGSVTISPGNSPTLSVTTLIFPGDIAIICENTSIFSASREKIKPLVNNNGGNMAQTKYLLNLSLEKNLLKTFQLF